MDNTGALNYTTLCDFYELTMGTAISRRGSRIK